MSPWLSTESQEGQQVRLNACLIVVGFEYIGKIKCRVGGLHLAWNSECPEGGKLPGLSAGVAAGASSRSPARVEVRQS